MSMALTIEGASAVGALASTVIPAAMAARSVLSPKTAMAGRLSVPNFSTRVLTSDGE